jgi:hypothetical protein
VAAAETEERGGADQSHPRQAESISKLGERAGGRGRLRPRDDDRDEVAERRIGELLTPDKLLRKEAGDVVAGGEKSSDDSFRISLGAGYDRGGKLIRGNVQVRN